MAFDETLAARVRGVLAGTSDVVEKKMFGGVGFLVQGNMSVGVQGPDLVVRIDPAESDEALEEPGARAFDPTGRPMKGWLRVSAEAVRDEEELARWVRRGVAFAQSLPAK